MDSVIKSVKLTERQDILHNFETLGIQINDLQTTWNNTLFIGKYEDKDIVLITGMKKYGIIDINADFPLINQNDNFSFTEEMKYFYKKNLGSDFEIKTSAAQRISKLI